MSPKDESANADSTLPCDDSLADDSSRRSNGKEIDTDLQRVLDAWPRLPAALKAGIMAMIDATGKTE